MLDEKFADLRAIFDFVRDHPNSSARQIGGIVDGGKSRANHFLYGYDGILFEKRGLTPPQWRVISDDGFGGMMQRLHPNPPPVVGPAVSTPAKRLWIQPKENLPARELPPISICNSCDLPIKPNGICGCS